METTDYALFLFHRYDGLSIEEIEKIMGVDVVRDLLKNRSNGNVA